MATKLGRRIMPSGHTRDDFECFGPTATEDGNFDNCMLADLGCFNQSMVDSNKFYHTSVVKSKTNGKWYTYYEWGRTGQTADFLFTECYDKSEAQQVMVKQLHSKNDKRGEWATIAGIKTLRAKDGKDCYLVRPAARRTTGLPDAQKIIHDDADKVKKIASSSSSAAKKKAAKKVASRWDKQTLALGMALTKTTIDYTRKSFAGDYVPTQKAIDEGRDVLTEAMKRVQKVGDNTDDQVNDRDLKELTTVLYSRIPKVKPVRAAESTWILSGDNIQGWQMDLDAFESALLSLAPVDDTVVAINDPFGGFDLKMKWMDPKTVEGKFIQSWMPEASANKHSWVGNMQIRNMWAMRQTQLVTGFSRKVDEIAKDRKSQREKPKFQPRSRPDLSPADQKRYKEANVAALFHGTRTVNVSGILRTGLKLPRQLVGVAITGAMFGPGIYWADDWRKSDGYTSRDGTHYARGAGKIAGRGAFMFVANVALGTPHVANSWSGYTKAPRGCHCVAGLAGKSGVQNNEWIVYDGAQNDLCYLVEYDTSQGRG